MHLVDEVKIRVKAGDGGKGSSSLRSEKFREFAGPDGGDGGKGGSIFIRSTSELNTLLDFRYQKHFIADNGSNGSSSHCTGACGKDLILNVPIGTQIFTEDFQYMIHDLTTEGEKIMIAQGGDGGLGNIHFKSSINRAPRKTSAPKKGDELHIWLTLKMFSDIGLVGLPNAGKSTLISLITGSKSKIGDYPFTTLSPKLGILKVGYNDIVIADLPGIIYGASEGHGLGLKFMKHIERCKILIHMIDITSNVIESYNTIRNELDQYGKKVNEKKEMILLNKSDLITKELAELKKNQLQEITSNKIIISSSFLQESLNEIINGIANIVEINQ